MRRLYRIDDFGRQPARGSGERPPGTPRASGCASAMKNLNETVKGRHVRRSLALLAAAAAAVTGCAATLPAVPGKPTDAFFSDASADQKLGRSMRDSAQRCRDRLVELRSSASGYRLTATVLSLLSGSIGVVAGTASAALAADRPGEVKALGITAAVAAGLTAVITPVLRPDAREQAYLSGYHRWQTANVRLRSLYTSEPLTAASAGPTEPEADRQVPWMRSERFQQAWSAMANDLDACAGTSFR
jgi:hypothetical protein